MNLSRAAWLRIIPFLLFMVLLAVRGYAPTIFSLEFDRRWLYGLTLPLVGGVMLYWWREYGELTRQNLPTLGEAGLAIVVGLVVFALWIRLDAPWMQIGEPTAIFAPVDEAGHLIWPLVVLRFLGATLVVPLMEELFWRAFLMRWVDNPQFEAVDPQRTSLKAVVLSTFVFVLAHPLWLAAAIAGLAYAWLYRYSGRLWTAVIAHAVTNGALGIWVVATGRWSFW